MKSEPVSEYENLEGSRARESITHHREKTVNETAGNADAIHYISLCRAVYRNPYNIIIYSEFSADPFYLFFFFCLVHLLFFFLSDVFRTYFIYLGI